MLDTGKSATTSDGGSGSDGSTSGGSTDGSSTGSGSSTSGGSTSGSSTSDSSTGTDTGSGETPSPVLFGFWGLNGFNNSAEELNGINTQFSATVFQVSGEAVPYSINQLGWVHDSSLKITMRFTHDYDQYKKIDGSFDINLWKADLDSWTADADGVGAGTETFADQVIPFVTNGTLVGHMILDDIANYSFDNPTALDPTAQELDEMACYSDSIFGDNLMTFVRQRCDLVPALPSGARYQCLDACVNQFTNYPGNPDEHGDVNAYASVVAAAASDRGLQVINGLNIADGGNGDSGQAGITNNHFAMSADEITDYGTVLLDKTFFPDLQLFLMWKYDGLHDWNGNSVPLNDPTAVSSYFNGTDVTAALKALGDAAASR